MIGAMTKAAFFAIAVIACLALIGFYVDYGP